MMYGFYKSGRMEQRVVFDIFYRMNPCDNGYVICAGLEQAVVYLRNLRFYPEEIAYLRSLGIFDEGFLKELEMFRFTGTVYAIPEGTVVFPQEPLLRLEGRIFELQLVESALLCFINHQSLIATKAARIVQATRGVLVEDAHPTSEFGLRRAQNGDAAVFGARAAYIGGCTSTSNVVAGYNFSIPVSGTQAHSWIQSFDSELEAFRAYVDAFPNRAVLLVDTYDVLRSGVPNAIRVGRELREKGFDLLGVRIDSGDLAYLSKAARKLLDEAGFQQTQIIASDDLDEDTIRDLMVQGAKIDGFGVGTALITAKGCPALGGVYKLAAEEKDGRFIPRIKVSENPLKVTNPGKKKVIRFYVGNKASADLIMLDEEAIPQGEPVTLFDPVHTYKRKTIYQYTVRELLIPVIVDGDIVYELPAVEEIRSFAQQELATLSSETLRPKNPHTYHVDLSLPLWELKRELMARMRTAGAN
ncbi:nicotinate phosphoribosyltransferase [Sulfoacidibacillus thermotolerans]|uniref:Nicotinate phosphoribosyltransferase n=2 Tax=Sulfoacidibacillus thermotolerans TaxID=1765684 RepID=A0A2U3DCM3_SULT2|nr:nicotinate phosphoribosyltransferase [Sulfoacidibacillus thermotolerans]